MLTFKHTNICFSILLILLLSLDWLLDISWLMYLLLLVTYSLLLFYGSYFVHSQFYMPAICKSSTHQKQIAISFDDGPQPNYTPQILDILKSYQVKASFFCIGKHALAHKNILHEIHQEGHIIGSHSFSHGRWFDLLSATKMQADLKRMHDFVSSELNIELKWFRPPYGVTNPNLKKAVEALNYTAIGWNVRSLDTIAKNKEALLQKLMRSLQPGSIYLFHDTTWITVQTLPLFLEKLKEAGYEVVPLDKLLHLQPYAP